jgi:hypothetical protein
MQQFKVITLSLGGHSNRIWQSQDVVSASDFPSEENVLQHVLTGGLHPLNADGSEMERVIITQEMLDEMTEEQKQALAKAGITVKPGMYTYKPNGSVEDEESGETMVKRIVTEEDLVNNPELAVQGINVGDEIEFPAPKEAEQPAAPKANAKKSTAKK